VISVIVTSSADPQALARLLTALVPAAADGLVREVAVVGARGLAAEIAEDAGAELFSSFADAFAATRAPWVASLSAEALFTPDWMERIAEHLRAEPAAPAQLVAAGFSLGARPAGWLVPKALAPSAVVVEQDLQRIARLGRRLRVLGAARRGR
jgi:hypothetical protein